MTISLHQTETCAPKSFTKAATKEKTTTLIQKLDDLQNLLFAEKKHSLLVILQGMDCSGKDGVLRHVFNHFNPINIQVHSFSVPTKEEIAHDFLWRAHKYTPAKGMVQIFNRSYYDDVLETRVHKQCSDAEAKQRMNAINHFEQLLKEDNNTTILKFYLHVSQSQQEKRMQERVDNPAKHWKFDAADYKEIALRDEYIKMYEDAIHHCKKIPWTIVPADKNWYKEYIISKTVVETLEAFNMKYPLLRDL
ncbi:MAG: polyphosphate kinase [Bacteroidota bacterium]|nr:polyphosphate kinase [Bacteroidota bacterium]